MRHLPEETNMETRLTIPPGIPALDRTRKRILDHQRCAHDSRALAGRLLTILDTDPRVDQPAKLVKVARLLDRNATFHARMAQYLTNKLAEISAAHAADETI